MILDSIENSKQLYRRDFDDDLGELTRAYVGVKQGEPFGILFTELSNDDGNGRPNYDLGILAKINEDKEWQLTRVFSLKPTKSNKYRFMNIEDKLHLAGPTAVKALDDALDALVDSEN